MKLHELSPAMGSIKSRVRVGRGLGSGVGKTSGRGQKGQKARAGGGVRIGFEGGQMPLYRRLPKRGFHNKWGTEIVIINVGLLEKFKSNTIIDPVMLIRTGIIKKVKDGIKILGSGEITKPFIVKAQAFSKSAREKIESVGGKAEVI